MSSINKIKVTFCFAFVASFVAPFSSAQGISLIGNTGYAQMCFEASNMAASSEIASYKDLQTCTKAIDYELLHKRDLIATYVNRGIIYATLNKVDRAREDYEKAMSMDDSLPAIYLNRGNLWFMLQQHDRAIDDYSRSLELELNQRHVAFLNRGLAHEYRGNLTQAQRDYQASLDLRPEWKDAQQKLARIERKLAN